MNYKIVPTKHKWAVVENKSDLIIEYCLTRDTARKLAKKLNYGKGFDGWSPIFIATKEKI